MRERFRRFVDNLDEKTARRELVRAYMQMERCQRILEGDDVSPVTMMDNGLSSDLELFYMCKKRMEELKDQPEKCDRRKTSGMTDYDMANRISTPLTDYVQRVLDDIKEKCSVRERAAAGARPSVQPLIDRYERELVRKKELERTRSKERSPYYLDEICLIFLNGF